MNDNTYRDILAQLAISREVTAELAKRAGDRKSVSKEAQAAMDRYAAILDRNNFDDMSVDDMLKAAGL